VQGREEGGLEGREGRRKEGRLEGREGRKEEGGKRRRNREGGIEELWTVELYTAGVALCQGSTVPG